MPHWLLFDRLIRFPDLLKGYKKGALCFRQDYMINFNLLVLYITKDSRFTYFSA